MWESILDYLFYLLELNSKVLESQLNRKHINPTTHNHGALSCYLSCHLHCGLHLLSHSTIHNPHNVLRITYYVLHVDIEFAELPTHPLSTSSEVPCVAPLPNEATAFLLTVSISLSFYLDFPLSLSCLAFRLHFYLMALLIAFSSLLLLSHWGKPRAGELITAMTNQFPCQTQTSCQVCGWHFPISGHSPRISCSFCP